MAAPIRWEEVSLWLLQGQRAAAAEMDGERDKRIERLISALEAGERMAATVRAVRDRLDFMPGSGLEVSAVTALSDALADWRQQVEPK